MGIFGKPKADRYLTDLVRYEASLIRCLANGWGLEPPPHTYIPDEMPQSEARRIRDNELVAAALYKRYKKTKK